MVKSYCLVLSSSQFTVDQVRDRTAEAVSVIVTASGSLTLTQNGRVPPHSILSG